MGIQECISADLECLENSRKIMETSADLFNTLSGQINVRNIFFEYNHVAQINSEPYTGENDVKETGELETEPY